MRLFLIKFDRVISALLGDGRPKVKQVMALAEFTWSDRAC
jgi:hypothetical protein